MLKFFPILLKICLAVLFCFIIKALYDVRQSYIELKEKECPTDVAYYRCGGTKKNPKWCVLQTYEH